MISSAYIRNFKGISKCTIENLGKFNLFIGKNDSCKSTILEAMNATLKEFTGPNLGTVMSRRGNVTGAGREIWYNYKTKNHVVSEMKFGSAAVLMSISYNEQTNEVLTNLTVHSRRQNRDVSHSGPSSYYRGWDWSSRVSQLAINFLDAFVVPERANFMSYIQNSVIIDSALRNDLKHIEEVLGKIKLQRKDREFGNFLFGIFGKGRSWEFIPHPDFHGEYRAAIIEGRRRIFLNGLGDGIKFGMLIVAKSMLIDNAALFVEEIENNQHPDSLRKLIHFVVEASKKNRLQVFATTHSRLTWNYFEHEFDSIADRNKNLRVLLVKRDNKTGVVTCNPQTQKDADEFWCETDKELFGTP